MATAAQITAHRAKMKRKAERVLTAGFQPVEGKAFAAVRLEMRTRGQFPTYNRGNLFESRGSIAKGNRHTGKPHEHCREKARNTGCPQ